MTEPIPAYDPLTKKSQCPVCKQWWTRLSAHRKGQACRPGQPLSAPSQPTIASTSIAASNSGSTSIAATATATGPHPVTVEEVPDEGDVIQSAFKESMPIGGEPLFYEEHPSKAGARHEYHTTSFAAHRTKQIFTGVRPPWDPFASMQEYTFARWILASGMSQRRIDELLRGPVFTAARKRYPDAYRSFTDVKSFLAFVDRIELPDMASWRVIEITVTGDVPDPRRPGMFLEETYELWARDPLELIRQLIGNPAFKDHMHYAPIKQYSKAQGTEGVQEWFSDMHTGDRWWELQTAIKCDDGTVVPVILASDKTQLSTLSGDKKAWPVYLTIGNISGEIRGQPSKHATLLLGYLPIAKLECFQKTHRKVEGHRLFHFAMQQLLAPLEAAGRGGVKMTCADSYNRVLFPILTAYQADFPEQCLITCVLSNRCPKCKVNRLERGQLLNSLYRDPDETLAHLKANDDPDLQHVIVPFWSKLPFVNIFSCMTPDILHQLHKGLFKDHLVSWTTHDLAEEVDARFARMPPYPGLRTFPRGISSISQWTGNEYRQMEKVYVALLAGLRSEDPRFILAARAALDFIFYAHCFPHTTSSLALMNNALVRFHANKQVFIDIGARKNDFNIPKIHSLEHYVPSIFDFGSVLPLSTDGPERLHIDYAKLGYRASNRKGYIRQMILWLTRREKIFWFDAYFDYCASIPACATYHADLTAPSDIPTSHSPDGVYDDELEAERPRVPDDDDDILDDLDSTVAGSLPAPRSAASPSGAAVQPAQLTAQLLSAAQILSHSLERSDAAEHTEGEDTADNETVTLGSASSTYKISKEPYYGRLLPIQISSRFGAKRFVDALRLFLSSETPGLNPLYLASLDQLRFGVYAQFKRDLPSLLGSQFGQAHRDVVFATHATNKLHSRFSTVLYISDKERASRRGVAGYRVGQVRAIFDLPAGIHSLRAPGSARHLAYLELFTPFTIPERYSRLYRVRRSMQLMERAALVVPLDSIFRSCHLAPDFGNIANRAWESSTVLEEAEHFYLNPYIDLHMFLFV